MTDSVSKLKELLFDQESATLTELRNSLELVADAERQTHDELTGHVRRLEEKIDPLLRRAGTPQAWRASIAEVLDDAIVDARETRQKQLTSAVAPLVVQTVHTELRNSEHEIVQMLYPHTGQIVKSFVVSAIKDMMNQINRRLEMNPLMLRIRSIVSGYSMAELALAETQQLQVEELYLIERGSGALLQRWPESAARSNSDIHMSGIITAINDFASHAFQQDGGGTLRSFEVDDFTVFLRASPVYLLAAKCRGSAVSGVEGMIDGEFVKVVSRQHDIEGESGGQSPGQTLPSHLLVDLRDRLEAGIEEKQRRLARAGLPFSPLKALVTMVTLALLATGGWFAFTTYEAAVARATARDAADRTASLGGFPINLDVGWRGRSIDASGFAPSPTAKAELLQRLQAALPMAEVTVGRVAVLSGAPDLTPQLVEVREGLQGLGAKVRQDLDGLGTEVANRAIRRSLEGAIKRLEQTRTEVDRLSRLGDEAGREVARKAAVVIETTLRDLDADRKLVLAAGEDLSRSTGLQRTFGAISTRLQHTASELSVLVGGAQSAAAVPLSTPAAATFVDTGDAAEDLGLAAERVATIATAAAQASSVRIPPPPPPAPVVIGPSARDLLVEFTRSHAVFFGDGDQFRESAKADAALDELARLMNQTTALVRVIGYTDAKAPNRNETLSRTRALRVVDALRARGIAPERLKAIGRANSLALSTEIGPQSPNRRVEFEVGFEDEGQ